MSRKNIKIKRKYVFKTFKDDYIQRRLVETLDFIKSLDNLKEIEDRQNSMGDSLVVFSIELEVGKTGKFS